MRGIIVTSGCSRGLWPVATPQSDTMLNAIAHEVADKPMIYYPLSVLLQTRIRHILVLATPQDAPHFQRALGGGEQWGISLSYAIQPAFDELAQVFLIAAEFIGAHNVALILDNQLFCDERLAANLEEAAQLKKGARVFAYKVPHSQPHNLAPFTQNGRELGLEQPPHCASRYVLLGLYFYDNTVAARAQTLLQAKSKRTDTTDLNKTYRDEGTLQVKVFADAESWMSIDDHTTLVAATRRIKTAEKRRKTKLGCPEEIAWRMGFINDEQLLGLATHAHKTSYGNYLRQLLH